MKHINHKTVFVSLLAFFLLVSFTPPLKKAKKVEEKPIATFLPMGGGIIASPSASLGVQDNRASFSELSSIPVIQNIQNSSTIDSVARLSTENGIHLNEIIQPITPLPVKPLPLNSKSGLFKLAEKLKSNTNEETANTQREYYKYDSTSKAFEKIVNKNLNSPLGVGGVLEAKAVGFDPVRFTLSSNKDSVSISEEIEIKITAEYLDVSPSLMFQFEGSNAYTLKMLLPEGFIQTGGTYYDYIQGKVDKANPKQEFIIKGVFETQDKEPCFSLLRSFAGAGVNDVWEKKFEHCVFIYRIVVESKIHSLRGDYSINGIPTLLTSAPNNCGLNAYSISIANCAVPSSITSINSASDYQNAVTFEAWNIYEDGTPSSSLPIDYNTLLTNAKPNISNGILSVNHTGIFFGCACMPSATIKRKIKIKCNGDNLTAEHTSNSINGFTKTPANPVNISVDVVCQTVTGTASCIDSSPVWYKDGNEVSFPITGIGAGGTYIVKCKSNNCVSSGISKTVSVFQISPPPLATSASRTGAGNVTVSASNCVGQGSYYSWYDTNGIILSYGNSYTQHIATTTVFYVSCVSSPYHCESTKVPVKATVTAPACGLTTPPTISGRSTIPSNGTPVTLTTSCNQGGSPIWSNGATTLSINVGVGDYSVKCEIPGSSPVCESGTSSIVKVQNCDPPTAPSITATPASFTNGGGSVSLTATGCSGIGEKVTWDNSLGDGNTKTPTISTTTTYKAYCTDAGGCKSSETSKEVVVNCDGATTPTISILSQTDNSVTLQAANCNGTVKWDNNAGRTGPTLTLSSGGKHFATCMVGTCESTKSNEINLGGGCDDFTIIAWANATAVVGSVSIGDRLEFTGGVSGESDPESKYSFEWYHNSVLRASTSSFVVAVASSGDSGYWSLHVRKKGTNSVCVETIYFDIAPCSFDASPSWNKDGTKLYFSVWTNKPVDGTATYYWTLPNNTTKTDKVFDIDAEPANRGKYTLTVAYKGCSVTKELSYVDFEAIPDYDGHIDHAWCDFVDGRANDKNNSGKEVEVELVISGGVSQTQKTVNNRFKFPIPESYKDGATRTVQVRIKGNSLLPPYQTSSKVLVCCKLELAATNSVTTNCNNITNKGSVTISFNRTAGQTVNYRIYKKFYNELSQVYYEPAGDWTLVAASTTTLTINNLDDGHYKVELKEGSVAQTACMATAIFSIDCKPIVNGCKPPIITVTPKDTIREGIGILPTLYADFVGVAGLPVANNGTNNGLQSGLLFDGSSGLQLTGIDGQQTFTFEAWISPLPNTHTTVGYIGDGEKHRYLLKSMYTPDSHTLFALSVGSNGITLIETNDKGTSPNISRTRVALSHESSIFGWTHLALVYNNNLPSLYLNGNLVAIATKTMQQQFNLTQNFTVKPGRQIGEDNDKGYKGYLDEIRGWSKALNPTEIHDAMLRKQDLTIVAEGSSTRNDIQGYWVFDNVNGFKNVKYPTHNEIAKKEGNVSNPDVSAMPVYEIPILNWYLGNTLVGTGTSYKMPANMVKADGVTYTLKYTGATGNQCETSKTVIIKRANQTKLSGCFTISPTIDLNRKLHYVNGNGVSRVGSSRTSVGEVGIWKFEYDDNGYYRIILPYQESLVTLNDGIQLKPRVTGQAEQLWKVKLIDSLSQNPKIRLQSKANSNQFITALDVNQNIGVNGELSLSDNRQTFQIEKTSCPTPPKPCIVNNKLTIEKVTALPATTITYLDQNPDRISEFITKIRGSNKTITEWGGPPSTTRISFNGGIPVTGDAADNFTVRISGFFCPPGTGNYKFGLVGVDKSLLYISPSEDERVKEQIVKNNATRSWDEWVDGDNKKSVEMTQGRSYYVEATMLVKNTYEYLKLGISGPGLNATEETQGAYLTNFSSIPRDKKPKRLRDDAEACGKMPEGPLASDDLPFLMKGDTIFAGDFQVIILAVSGANGTFSGTGTAKVKYLYDTPIKVRFDGVRVNDYYDLVSGEITTEYDKDWSNIVDADEVIKDVIDGIKSFADGADKLCDFDPDKYSGKALDGLGASLLDDAAKEVDNTLADGYRNLITAMKTQMTIIDANRDACRAIPPDQTACTAVSNATFALKDPNGTIQQTCNNLENQRTNKLTAFAEIIEMALDKIELDTKSGSADRNNANSTYSSALSNLLGANPAPTPAQLATYKEGKEVEASSLDGSSVSSTEKENIRNYFEKELKINKVILSFNFAKMKRSDAKKLGEEISIKTGEKLSKYIIEELSSFGASPTLAQKQQLAFGSHPNGNVKDKILDTIYEILSESVYKD